MNSLEILKEAGIYKEPLKLHLGCGSNYLKDYINIDLPSSEHSVMNVKVDATADITKDLNFPENSVDEIKLLHVFEHFPRTIALAQLIKWHYWLKIDGILIIETPDFRASIKQFLEAPYKQQMAIVRHLTGDQSDRWAFHVDQLWDERFETTLSAFGFHITDIVKTKWNRWPELASITVTAIKLENREIKNQFEVATNLLKESMVSEREQKTYEVWENQLRKELEEGGLL